MRPSSAVETRGQLEHRTPLQQQFASTRCNNLHSRIATASTSRRTAILVHLAQHRVSCSGQTASSSTATTYAISLPFLLASSYFQIKVFPKPDVVSSYLVVLRAFLYTNLSSHPLNPTKLLASTATFGSEFLVSTTSCKENILLLFALSLASSRSFNDLNWCTATEQTIPAHLLSDAAALQNSVLPHQHLFSRPRSFSLIYCSSHGSRSAQHFYLSLNYSKFCYVWDEQSRTACALQGRGKYEWRINHPFPFLLSSLYDRLISHSGNTIFLMLEAVQSR